MVNALDTTLDTTTTITTHDSPSPRLRVEGGRNLAKCNQCNWCACDDNCDCIGGGGFSGNNCDQCNSCACDDNCDCIGGGSGGNKCDQCNSCQFDDNCDCVAPITTTPIVGCDPNGGSCACGFGGGGRTRSITLNRFWGDSSDEQV